MSSQNLIIYNFSSLYHILEELDLDLNFNIIYIDNENSLNDKIRSLDNYLIISNKKALNNRYQIILNKNMYLHSILILRLNTSFSVLVMPSF